MEEVAGMEKYGDFSPAGASQGSEKKLLRLGCHATRSDMSEVHDQLAGLLPNSVVMNILR